MPECAPNLVLPGEPDFVYLATLSRLTGFLDAVTELYGAHRQYPIYSTEYGYRTNPPSTRRALARPGRRVPELGRVHLLADAPAALVGPVPARGSPGRGPSAFITGLEYDTGQPKPIVYDAWRMPLFLPLTRERTGHRLEVWGCVRPAHYTSRPQDVRVQLQAGGHGGFQTVETVPVTDPNGYFDTSVGSHQAVRSGWPGPIHTAPPSTVAWSRSASADRGATYAPVAS